LLNESYASVRGDVNVITRGAGADAHGVKITISQAIPVDPDDHDEGDTEARIDGNVVVTSEKGSAHGVELGSVAGGTFVVTGDIRATGGGGNSEASALSFDVGDGSTAEIAGNVTATATSEALGIDVTAGDDANFTIHGDVSATVNGPSALDATGVYIEAGDGLDLVVDGDVSARILGKGSAEGTTAGGIRVAAADQASVEITGEVSVEATERLLAVEAVSLEAGDDATL